MAMAQRGEFSQLVAQAQAGAEEHRRAKRASKASASVDEEAAARKLVSEVISLVAKGAMSRAT